MVTICTMRMKGAMWEEMIVWICSGSCIPDSSPHGSPNAKMTPPAMPKTKEKINRKR